MYYIGILYSMYMYIYIYTNILNTLSYIVIYIYTHIIMLYILCVTGGNGQPADLGIEMDPGIETRNSSELPSISKVGSNGSVGKIMGKSVKNDEHFKKNEVLN